ncbi:unnamed protein product [Phaeothamnion confervicola]
MPFSRPAVAVMAGAEESAEQSRDALLTRGGAAPKYERHFGPASFWGVFTVLIVLANAVKRLAPIAMQPFSQGDFLPYQWGLYAAFAAFMAYAEGFKGFQKKFSPLVVKRALTLDDGAGPLRVLLAGPYSMGLFHASRKRKTVSWCLTVGVFGLVQLVKRLPYPWRSIVDAGVVVGLSYGALSIAVIYARSLFGKSPDIDPAMPPPPKAG